MVKTYEGKLEAKKYKFAIIVSRFNDFIVNKLLGGSMDALIRHGAEEKNIEVIKVPGAFEIPLAAKKLAKSGKYDAVHLSWRRDTGRHPHFEYVASEVTKGIASVSLEQEVPVSFGILTTENIEQAIERAGTKSGNKGWDAAVCAIEMVNVLTQV